jgi:hypothetical protein
MAMSVKVFDSLTNRDFGNGAIRDEIRRSLMELERITQQPHNPPLKADKLPECQCLNFENAILCHQWENGKCKPLAP